MAYFPAVMILGKLLFKNQVAWPLSFFFLFFLSSPGMTFLSQAVREEKGVRKGWSTKKEKKSSIMFHLFCALFLFLWLLTLIS